MLNYAIASSLLNHYPQAAVVIGLYATLSHLARERGKWRVSENVASLAWRLCMSKCCIYRWATAEAGKAMQAMRGASCCFFGAGNSAHVVCSAHARSRIRARHATSCEIIKYEYRRESAIMKHRAFARLTAVPVAFCNLYGVAKYRRRRRRVSSRCRRLNAEAYQNRVGGQNQSPQAHARIF